jgi:NADH-ubiquinone oxidoreductase chain 2
MIFLAGSLATCGLIHTCIGSGLGIYNGLFHSTVTTQSFDLFIYIIGAIILLLTGFSPRRIIEPLVKPVLGLTSSNMSERGLGLKSLLLSIDYVTYYKKMLRGITAPIHKMIEYPLIILFILVGSIALISSSDYLTMFLAIELQSYGLYILVALHRNSEWSIVAGLTYFLLGGLASCFILLGSSFLYASSGVTFFDGMYIFEKMSIICVESRLIIKVLQKKPLLLSMGLLILAVGYLFKVSAAPFHSWSPDVYDAVPTIVTTFIATMAKISIFIFLLELVCNTGQPANGFNWTNILLISAFLSLMVGTIGGLVQSRIKRLLAYSTISHLGFILLALTINSVESIQAFVFYLMQYSLSNVNIFFIIILIGYSLVYYIKAELDPSKVSVEAASHHTVPSVSTTSGIGHEKMEIENSPIQLIKQLKGYFHLNPVLAICLAITIFSFIGVPPLIGFFAKQMVFSAALQSGFYFLTLVGILTSVIGAVYYLSIIKAVFFENTDLRLRSSLGYEVPAINAITLIKIPTIVEHRLPLMTASLMKYINPENLSYLVLSSHLSVTVSSLTLIIGLFIMNPQVWLNSANILAMHTITEE